jgi:mannan endo-1,4-beta-mannosidase
MYCLALLGVFIFQACGGDDEKEDPVDLIRPLLESSIPADGTMGVDVKTSVAKLFFDTEIVLLSASRIRLNGVAIENASINSDTLLLMLPSLVGETEYTLVLQPLAIKAKGKAVNEEILIGFTTAATEQVNIMSDLAVDNPSSQVQNLYHFLKENYGKKMISSTVANVNWNTNEAQWVKQHTGNYPAMATFDYIHLMSSPTSWIDYSNTDVVEEWWNNNGIVSACWHWNVPKSQSSTEYTYKPSETTFKTSNTTVDGTWENDVVNADLEKIANYLKLLQAKDIPVIWRPLHEAAGNRYEYSDGKAWFWWGNDGGEAYKDLWIYMFDYFEAEGLNNLIWVWTTQTKDNAFYPGDAYVDIIGRDIYNNTGATSLGAEFNAIQDTYYNKIVTLSECGNVANIAAQWNSGAKWSFFMPWYDYERTNNVNDTDFSSTDHEHANATWWNDAFAQDYVITRDEVPSLK